MHEIILRQHDAARKLDGKGFILDTLCGKTYALSTAQGQMLRLGMYPAVISWSRRESIISALYRSSAYIVDPGSAMAYGGLQDYRATEGESRPALILTERSPALSAETVSKAMGITEETLKARLNLN